MNAMSKCVVALLMVAGLSAAASAGTIDLMVGYLYNDAAATTLLDTGMTALLVADADGNGWDAYQNLSPDSFVAEGDRIIAIFGINGAMGAAGTHADTHNWDNTGRGVAEGNEFALLWFNTPYSLGIENVGPGAGVSFGLYRSDAVLGDWSFVVGPNNKAGFLQVFTASTGAGAIADSAMAATFVTIPEPTTMALLAVGGLLAVRRRNARA